MSQVMCHMSRVMCHMSFVMCYMSCVTCHVSHVTIFLIIFLDKVVKLVGGGSVINGAAPSSYFDIKDNMILDTVKYNGANSLTNLGQLFVF